MAAPRFQRGFVSRAFPWRPNIIPFRFLYVNDFFYFFKLFLLRSYHVQKSPYLCIQFVANLSSLLKKS